MQLVLFLQNRSPRQSTRSAGLHTETLPSSCGLRQSSPLSEAQTANAHGGRQASLWERRSSPVPGEASLASLKARSWWPRTDTESSHTDQRRRLGVDDIIVGALFYNNVLTSSLIHTQFAYATVNHELNSHSNNEPPNSQKIFLSKRT